MYSPQSQAILDTLLRGESVTSDTFEIAKLDDAGTRLLGIIIEKYSEFSKIGGAERAKRLRECYKAQCEQEACESADSEKEPPEDTQAAADVDVVEDADVHRVYRLQKVTCTSFRGIAPVGDEVEFEFNAKSNLIYGPNGSGKSSLLGAVVWVLTGNTICDADIDAEKLPDAVAVYKASDSDTKHKKVRDWPIVATLPESGITTESVPECTVTVELVTTEGAASLHLRRSIGVDLESSLNGVDWEDCLDLSRFGISPLDLQLSLVAPNVFSRCTVESAPDSTKLLSLMLGFDDLDDLGELASNMSRNRTSLANQEKLNVESAETELKQNLKQLPELLPSTHELLAEIENLADQEKPTNDSIKTVGEQISDAVVTAETKLAELVGLETDDADQPKDLAGDLTKALVELEKGVSTNFPSFGKLSLTVALPDSDAMVSEEILQKRSGELDQFIADASKQISDRLEWWQKETESEDNVMLLLAAAEFYDSEQEICPVCGLSIGHLPISDELSQMRDIDPKLRESLNHFFRSLTDELFAIVDLPLCDLADSTPQDQIRADWKHLIRTVIPAELTPIAMKYADEIEGIADNIVIDKISSTTLFPEDVDEGFQNEGAEFLRHLDRARTAITYLQWSNENFTKAIDRIHGVVFATDDKKRQSLFGSLSNGKEAATAIKPLKTLQKQLGNVLLLRA